MRTYAQLTTSFAIFCNRVGMDETISFWGGSEVVSPSGETLFSAPLFDEGLYFVDVELGDVRRERIGLPLLRDERPELHLRELRRILAERTQMPLDQASERPVVQNTEPEPRSTRPKVHRRKKGAR
jgi:hypothetical protein